MLADGSQTRVPPPHVTSNHVYSSAYRKAKAKGLTLEECRQSGKDALAYFVQSGLVDDRCGIFRENPNKSKTGGPPQDVAPQEDGRHVAPQEEDHPEL